MQATILKTDWIIEKVKSEIKAELKKRKEGIPIPGLAVIMVGTDEASQLYMRKIQKNCEEIGIYYEEEILSEINNSKLKESIKLKNQSSKIQGIIVQYPLPQQIDKKIIYEISPEKDIDCLHPYNFGLLARGEARFIPATCLSVLRILDEYSIPLEGRSTVVVGRSNIVGKPLSLLLLQRNATVTICHTKTHNLSDYTRNAEIICVAAGRPNLITEEMVSSQSVIIDIGTNVIENKLVGDVDFEKVKEKVKAITPCRPGVGALTNWMLIKNLILSWELNGTN